MEQTVSQTDKKGDIAVHGSIEPAAGGVHILHGAEKSPEPLGMIERKQVIEELRQTLDLVDFYAAKLADSSLPARGMSPLISHLEDRLDALQGMESSPNLPEKLRPILSDVVITIGTEIARFRRGDYA